ncbi:MAG TPA: sigma-70 family RNA polymerase sigma factor [Ktedonobacteraceae bacterium]|jgi:RNA polymerase sigma-70 factor (ECF subfamily)|nr:sigma-70 family RNA polymerase sigma factor [Ktedonobacteraceae bacterium]
MKVEDSKASWSDDQILREFVVDPQAGFDKLYHTYEPIIRGRLAKQLGRPQDDTDVDECVQRTFIRAYKALNNRRDKKEVEALSNYLRPWLYTIARNVLREFSGSRAEIQTHEQTTLTFDTEENTPLLDKMPEDEKNQPEALIAQKEERNAVHTAIDTLPERYRVAVYFYYIQEKEHHEIAAELHESENTVKSWVYRGLEMLHKYMKLMENIPAHEKEIRRHIDMLPKTCKIPVMLHFFEQKAFDLIAQFTNTTEEEVRKRLHRGVGIVYKHLQASSETR